MRSVTLVMASLISILTASSASLAQQNGSPLAAEGFGRRSSSIVVLEDVFGFVDQDLSGAQAPWFAESVSDSGTGVFPSRVFQVGYHHAVHRGLTLGTGVGVWYSRSELSGTTLGDLKTLHLEARPRIGYAIPLSPAFALWPRAGIGYWRRRSETGVGSTTVTAWSEDLDLLAVVTPTQHVGILAGLKLSIPMSGELSSSDGASQYVEHSMTSLTIGLLADF